MPSFWHKKAFECGMKDAWAYCFWPHTFPSIDVCKSKIALFFPLTPLQPVCNMKAGSGSFFLTQINKQSCYSLSEMTCRDPVVGVAAGLSWWMTEKLTLRSATAHALISLLFFLAESGDNKHIWHIMMPQSSKTWCDHQQTLQWVHPSTKKNNAKCK